MNSKKNIIGEVSVEVKAGLSVDEITFKTCLNFIAIHAQNKGLKGMVVRFDDRICEGCYIKPLTTEDEVKAALYASPDMFKEQGSDD